MLSGAEYSASQQERAFRDQYDHRSLKIAQVQTRENYADSMFQLEGSTRRRKTEAGYISASSTENDGGFRFSSAQAGLVEEAAKTPQSVAQLAFVLQQQARERFVRAYAPVRQALADSERVVRGSEKLLSEFGPKDNFAVDTRTIRAGYVSIKKDALDSAKDSTFRNLQPLYEKANHIDAYQNPTFISAFKSAIEAVAHIRDAEKNIVRAARNTQDVSMPFGGGMHAPGGDGMPNPHGLIPHSQVFNSSNGLTENMLNTLRQSGKLGDGIIDPQSQISSIPGHMSKGFFNEIAGEETDTYRLTWDKLLEMNVQWINGGVLMDTAEKYMAFVHSLGTLRVVPIPFTLYMVSQEWDPMMMDLDVEEVSYREGIYRGRSEKRSFTRFGKALRCTVESLQAPEGRRVVVMKAMQIGAGIGQSECWVALAACIEAANTEESRIRQGRLSPAKRDYETGLNNLINDAKRWALLQRPNSNGLAQIMTECENEFTDRGMYDAGSRPKIFYYSKGTSLAMSGAKKPKGVNMFKIPVFKPDKVTEVDMLQAPKQHGETFGIPWDPQHVVYETLSDRSYANYNYNNLFGEIVHHNGTISRVSLAQCMRHWQNCTDPNFWRQLFAMRDGQTEVTIQNLIDAAGDNEEEKRHRTEAAAARFEALTGEAVDREGIWLRHKVFKTTDLGTFKECIDKNFPLFLNGRHAAPYMIYVMGEGLVYAKGADSYEHRITPPLMQVSTTALHRNVEMSIRKDTMALAKESRAFIAQRALSVIDYVHGDGANSFWAAQDGDASKPGPTAVQSYTAKNVLQGSPTNNLPSAFLLLDSVDEPECNMEPALDLTGTFDSTLGFAEKEEGKQHYRMADYYSTLYGWNRDSSAEIAPAQAGVCSVHGGNTLCYRRDVHYSVLDSQGNVSTQRKHVPGTGPRAAIIFDPQFRELPTGYRINFDNAMYQIEKLSGKPTMQMASRNSYVGMRVM
jgi:hypothetical protein